MNWLTQNWPWIVVGVVVLAMLNRSTRYRRRTLGYPVGDEGSEIPTQADTAVDPVTQKTIPTAGAVTSAFQGRIYYFESPETRLRFEASPAQYAVAAPARRAASSQSEPRAGGHRHGGGCC